MGPNELELAAVRAPDGSLIYLVDQEADVYGTDFNLQPGAVIGAGLKRIDHMAMALPADSLDSWVLFYKSLLDFEADDEVVLPDPYGLVKPCAAQPLQFDSLAAEHFREPQHRDLTRAVELSRLRRASHRL